MCTQCESIRWSVDSSFQKLISVYSIATRYWYGSELQYCLVANNSYKIINKVPVLHYSVYSEFYSTVQTFYLFLGIVFLKTSFLYFGRGYMA